MGVNTTSDLYKSLTFDGKSSRNYGVYITGEAVFNAPARAVEMITIPGRNGAFALDKGHFENIEVTYPAGIYADNEEDFAEAISDFRNFLCSRSGYCRLTDDYNADEYRLAIYKSGLEVEPAQLKAGEFNITFECKPQRFLTSGETAVTVANNGTLTNPTLFESRPTLQFQGYGNIGINDQNIDVQNIPIGQVLLANSKNVYIDYPFYTAPLTTDYVGSQFINTNQLAPGDTLTLDTTTFTYVMTTLDKDEHFWQATATDQTGTSVKTAAVMAGKSGTWTTTFEPITFTKGTSSSVTHTYDMNFGMGNAPGYGHSGTYPITIVISYDGSNEISLSATKLVHYGGETLSGTAFLNSVTGISSITASGTITVNLDIGESYFETNSSTVDANYAVSLGASLPTLKPGSNTFTYPNTITQFKVIPNWWKV